MVNARLYPGPEAAREQTKKEKRLTKVSPFTSNGLEGFPEKTIGCGDAPPRKLAVWKKESSSWPVDTCRGRLKAKSSSAWRVSSGVGGSGEAAKTVA